MSSKQVRVIVEIDVATSDVAKAVRRVEAALDYIGDLDEDSLISESWYDVLSATQFSEEA